MVIVEDVIDDRHEECGHAFFGRHELAGTVEDEEVSAVTATGDAGFDEVVLVVEGVDSDEGIRGNLVFVKDGFDVAIAVVADGAVNRDGRAVEAFDGEADAEAVEVTVDFTLVEVNAQVGVAAFDEALHFVQVVVDVKSHCRFSLWLD